MDIVKKEKQMLEKITSLANINQLWLVTFRQSCLDIHNAVANGRFFIATDLDDALKKFTDWANDRRMTTSDVYATSVGNVMNRQKEELKRGKITDYGMEL